MKIVFFGDGPWATGCLFRLVQDGHSVHTVVLRRKPTDSGLEDLAREIGAEVRAPERANDSGFVQWLGSLEPDLNVSMSYNQILKQPILESARLGFINCHAGKLPYYRGRNVINWAIINNESEIGLTIHYMDQGIDTGDIILQSMLPIEWHDTYGSILTKVQDGFPPLLAEAVSLIANNRACRRQQDPGEGTYFSRRIPGDEWIDWQDSSLNIYNKIRAITHPGPGALTLLGEKTLILWQAQYDPSWPEYLAIPGQVVGVIPGQGVRVKTGDSVIVLSSVQIEASPGEEAHEEVPRFPIGTRLGLGPMAMAQELGRLRELIGKMPA